MQQLTRSHLTTCLFSVVQISGAPATVQAAADQATIQEILDGDQLFIDSRKARVRETAQTPQVISTGDSRGQLKFSSDAVGRINRQSLLKLGSSCFLLNKGQILISGQIQPDYLHTDVSPEADAPALIGGAEMGGERIRNISFMHWLGD